MAYSYIPKKNSRPQRVRRHICWTCAGCKGCIYLNAKTGIDKECNVIDLDENERSSTEEVVNTKEDTATERSENSNLKWIWASGANMAAKKKGCRDECQTVCLTK